MSISKIRTDAGKKDTLLRVIKLIRPYLWRCVLSLLLAVVVVAATLYVPVLIGNAVDLLLGRGITDLDGVIKVILRMGITILITSVCQYLMDIINNKTVYRVVLDIRKMAFEKLHRLPVAYIDAHSHGDLISRMITDVDQFSEGLLLGFAQLFTGVLTIAVTLIYMFTINPYIALVVVVLTPLSIIVAKFFAKRTYTHFKRQSECRADVTAAAEEMVSGQSTVQSYNMEDKVCTDFEEKDRRLRDASIKAVFLSSVSFPTTRFVNNMIYAAVAAFGAFSAINGRITVGKLTSFLSYATQYTKPFNEISSVITELQNSLACAERIFEFLDEEEITADDDSVELPADIEGHVELENVRFSYDKSKQLIRDLNLDVKPGQRIAIVGPTGCGKTTLINLLMRFYEADGGRISVEGIDIRDLKRHSLRRSFGMVLQDTWLRSGTIRDNIAMGRPDATDEEIRAAAKMAYADDFINKLPQGYDTTVTHEGGNLSAGQRQLLCIARIMLTLPPMLILDEATSSIDTRTEIRVQEAFERMMRGRTSFIVAHRLSTIKSADIILVMKDGRIIEKGKHEELLKSDGFYAEMYRSQFAGKNL
jgi:ATP-binding cassette subfamily B multidrug efflux pump